jgi:hypothetical protein
MNSWQSYEARQKAKQAFWEKLNKPENRGPGGLRERCINHPQIARVEFARCGEFYLAEHDRPERDRGLAPIPVDTEFRVFPEDLRAREKLVVLVLREDPSGSEPTDPQQIWHCTYYPYVS